MNLLEQIKQRRQQLRIKQSDMQLRIGMNRQQYQQLEQKGNPRLNTLELIATGLDAEIMLIPRDKLRQVQSVLTDSANPAGSSDLASITDDPWQDALE